jgi:hypothetical protein
VVLDGIAKLSNNQLEMPDDSNDELGVDEGMEDD